MKTAIELNNFIAQKRMYCGAAARYTNLVNSFVSVLNPTEDVSFIAGTETIQDSTGVKNELSLVAVTSERVIYGSANGFLQYARSQYTGINNQVVNNEGWVTASFNDGAYVMFKTLGAQVLTAATMFNECLDEAAMAAKQEREAQQRVAAAIAEDKRNEIQREHFEYDIQSIQTPVGTAIDKARLCSIIEDYAGRGYRLHTMTSNEIVAIDGSKCREDILVFERKYR